MQNTTLKKIKSENTYAPDLTFICHEDINHVKELDMLKVKPDNKEWYTCDFNGKTYDTFYDPFKEMGVPFTGYPLYVVKGEYKKDSNEFDTTKDGDFLIAIDWGGIHNDGEGIDISQVNEYKYYYQASDDDSGIDYIVIPEKLKNL
jgi:hypothetical protein